MAETARARSLPAFTCGSTVSMLAKLNCTCPASRSLVAGALPARADRSPAASQLMKSDLDRVAEAHQREIFAGLKVLARLRGA